MTFCGQAALMSGQVAGLSGQVAARLRFLEASVLWGRVWHV